MVTIQRGEDVGMGCCGSKSRHSLVDVTRGHVVGVTRAWRCSALELIKARALLQELPDDTPLRLRAAPQLRQLGAGAAREAPPQLGPAAQRPALARERLEARGLLRQGLRPERPGRGSGAARRLGLCFGGLQQPLAARRQRLPQCRSAVRRIGGRGACRAWWCAKARYD